MSYSEIAKEQRAKEASALKSFLCLSLLGSLALHIGVLAFGVGNFLARTPRTSYEPIEVTIIDTPESEAKPKEAQKLEIQKLPAKDSTTAVKLVPPSKTVVVKQPIEQQLKQSPTIIQQKEIHQSLEKKSLQTTTPLSKPIKVSNEEITRKSDATRTSRNNSTANYSSAPNSENKQGTGENLREQLRGIRDARVTQQVHQSAGGGGSNSGSTVLTGSASGLASSNGITSNGSGTDKGNGNGNGIGLGTGNGNGIGSGSGNGIGNNNSNGKGSTVATAPRTPRIEAVPKNPGNSEGNGRAACRECRTRYPDAARRQGIEGKVEVSVDTDEQGNVTNVHIARSSGNRDLDEDTLRQAREWKLKPVSGGREGVSIATEYAIEGSRRYQALQERKRQTEARNRETTTANSDSHQEAPRRRRRLVTTTNADVPRLIRSTTSQESALDRQLNRIRTSNPSLKEQTATSIQQSRVTSSDNPNTTKRRRREQISSDRPNRLQQALRRKRRSQQGASDSQNRLLDILRRHRERAQPSPSTPDSSATNN